jgi:hypothetical protein
VPIAPATPAQRAISAGAIPLAIDETGVPRLLRAADSTALASPELHVARLAPAWGVDRMPQLVNVGDV